MTIRVAVAPAEEPVTLDEVKLHLRETETGQDELISALIIAARQYAENYTRRALVTQTLELGLPAFPDAGVIELPRPPLQSLTWVKYIDFNGNLQTVDPTTYQIDTFREPAQVKPAYLRWWFWYQVRNDFNAVQLRYVAGYPGVGSPADLTSGIPEAIKHWMKVCVAQLYEHREAIVVERATLIDIPRSYIDGLLDPYVVDLF